MSTPVTTTQTDAAGAAPMAQPIPTYAWKSAYALVGATILAVALGIGYFTYGGVFGPLSDAGGLLVAVFLAPLVWSMFLLYQGERYTRGVSLLGAAAILGIGLGSIGLILGSMLPSIQAILGGGFLGIQFIGWLLLGGWMLGVGAIGLRTDTVPRRVSWAATVAGVGTAGGMVTLVYSYAVGSFTLLFPAFMGLYLVGFVVWAFWIGGELRASATA